MSTPFKNKTLKRDEQIDSVWTGIFTYMFGTTAIVLGIISWIMIVHYLRGDKGGLGPRDPSQRTADYFNWHPLLMGLSVLVLMVPAVLAFEVYACFGRKDNKAIHGGLQALAIVVMFTGFGIVYDANVVIDGRHAAATIHSVTGYMTLSLVASAFAMGFILFVIKAGGDLRRSLRPFHKRLGLFALLTAFAAVFTGIQQISAADEVGSSTRTFTQVITALITTCLGALFFSLIRFANKEDVQGTAAGDDEAGGYQYIADREMSKTKSVQLTHNDEEENGATAVGNGATAGNL